MKNQSFIILLSLLLSNAAFGQELKEVDYKEGNQALKGMVSSNAGKNLPGVLILPAWKGIDQEAKDAAIALEKEGYIALIADIYGVGIPLRIMLHLQNCRPSIKMIIKPIKKGYKLA